MTVSLYAAERYVGSELVAILNDSYADYLLPVRFSDRQYQFFLRSHDIDLSLSVVACVDDIPAGIVQVARRGERGWIGGVGVRPRYRRQGLARLMMMAATNQAADAGMSQLQLEVLTTNQPALDLYRGLGWRLERELLFWQRPRLAQNANPEEGGISEHDPGLLLRAYFDWHEQPPCWQRSSQTLEHYIPMGIDGWILQLNGEAAAYALVSSGHSDMASILDLAVNPVFDRKRTSRILLAHLHDCYPQVVFTLVNQPQGRDMDAGLVMSDYTVLHKQYEMSMPLPAPHSGEY